MSVFNSAADQMCFDIHTVRRSDTLIRDRDQILCHLNLYTMRCIKPVNPCLAHPNAAVSKWLRTVFLSNFSSCGFFSFAEPSQHYRNELAPDHKESAQRERTHGDEWSVIFKLVFSAFSSCSLLQAYWETAQAGRANTGCDQGGSEGKVPPLQELRRARLGSLSSSSSEAVPVFVSGHWGFG